MTHRDDIGARYGMWLFLYTEIMLFSGLFVLYAGYYYQYTSYFIEGGKEMDLFIGTLNTAILIISSFMVATSVAAMKRGSKKTVLILLGIAILLGFVFLFNKYLEWSHKFGEGIFPGSDTLINGPHGRIIFFGLYFTLTGLHALHVTVGIIALTVCVIFTKKGAISAERVTILDNVGLYWHLVDLIWIFLFPLFYLIL